MAGIRTNNGFALIELIIGLLIVALLMTMTVSPIERFLARHWYSQFYNQLVLTLNMAKQLALTAEQGVTLCPVLDNTAQCGQFWQQGWLIKSLDTNKILYRFDAMPRHIYMKWHGGGIEANKIKISRFGQVDTPGHFTYCPIQGLCWSVVLGQSGYVYSKSQH